MAQPQVLSGVISRGGHGAWIDFIQIAQEGTCFLQEMVLVVGEV